MEELFVVSCVLWGFLEFIDERLTEAENWGRVPFNFLLSTIALGWLSWFDDRVRVRSHIYCGLGLYPNVWPRLD
ncbi:hypothetical protein CROQUDRAFT_654146 [Cronartium quercuum f. sp. fusiforme G11]|uniref:Uncharacterized protein n=1 Tax=Cronartium quercuum f. sp. fusiforme G11 TaxID=708437 RepID=A0A9P6NRR6_9BASI|nr:hypothetical protein CROQUDRAFT_654146 [Cronartium quercuum f. sp. fusiforme G11]